MQKKPRPLPKNPNELFRDWLDALETIPIHKKQKWIQETLRPKSMLPVFGLYYFPNIIIEDVPQCHVDLIEEISRPGDSGIIFPRGFAKSTWTKIDTLHDIVYALEPVIVYISATLEDAGFQFESIRSELENNELLRSVYGNLVPRKSFFDLSVKWTNKHFETTNGVNVVARGANNGRGVNIKNRRPTKIIVDDAETDKQVRSVMQRQQYHDWLYNVMMPSLDPIIGRIKVIGTVIHPECEVLKFYKEHGGIMRKAIENIKIAGVLSSGESIWPSYMTMARLMEKKKKVGTRTFMQEWMQEPTNIELARIKPEWIDENVYVILPKNRMKLNKVISIDPQSGEKNTADEYAITVVAWYTGDGHRYVLEQEAGRASQLQQATQAIKMWLKHPTALTVDVEKVLSQVAVYQNLLAWKAGNLILVDGVDSTNRNIPVHAVSPEGKDKVARFEAHEAMIERGELHLRPEMNVLREQILFLGMGTLEHDDRVDSLVMGLDASYKHNSGGNRLAGLTEKTTTQSSNLLKAQF